MEKGKGKKQRTSNVKPRVSQRRSQDHLRRKKAPSSPFGEENVQGKVMGAGGVSGGGARKQKKSPKGFPRILFPLEEMKLQRKRVGVSTSSQKILGGYRFPESKKKGRHGLRKRQNNGSVSAKIYNAGKKRGGSSSCRGGYGGYHPSFLLKGEPGWRDIGL